MAASINEFTGGHVQASPFVGDVTDATFRRAVYDQVIGAHGVPRICVPAAGVNRDSLAAKINKETGKAELYSIDEFRLTSKST